MESLVVGYEDGTVELLDITSGSYEVTGMLTRSDLGFAIRSVKFSPNGQRVAVASEYACISRAILNKKLTHPPVRRLSKSSMFGIQRRFKCSKGMNEEYAP